MWLMLFMGFLGYGMRKFEIPLAPICLGIILGPMVEANLARALSVASAKSTNLLFMSFTRPICIILIILVILSLLTPYLSARAAGKRAKELRSAKADVEETMETE
jgi:putative tricarboxylic transport membrane protein